MCGEVRYELAAPPEYAGYCHCTRCQHRTGGSAAVSARTVPGSYRVTSGEELIAVYRPERGYEKAFCSQCGSALFSRDPGSDEYTGVRLGAVDGDPGIRPESHAFVAYAASWEPIPDDGLPRYPEARPGYAEGR